jgi:hypothetical protein
MVETVLDVFKAGVFREQNGKISVQISNWRSERWHCLYTTLHCSRLFWNDRKYICLALFYSQTIGFSYTKSRGQRCLKFSSLCFLVCANFCP